MRLAAEIECSGMLDRLLLAVGGRWWLTRRFASTLERLSEELRRRQARSAEVGATGRGARV